MLQTRTDRRDALRIAHVLRMGWYRSVHCKAVASKEIRILLTARKLSQGKLIEISLPYGPIRSGGLPSFQDRTTDKEGVAGLASDDRIIRHCSVAFVGSATPAYFAELLSSLMLIR